MITCICQNVKQIFFLFLHVEYSLEVAAYILVQHKYKQIMYFRDHKNVINLFKSNTLVPYLISRSAFNPPEVDYNITLLLMQTTSDTENYVNMSPFIFWHCGLTVLQSLHAKSTKWTPPDAEKARINNANAHALNPPWY